VQKTELKTSAVELPAAVSPNSHEANLFRQVVANNGNVDGQTARSFVNNAFYGGFGPNFSFEKLDINTRVNLYTSVIKNAEVTPNHQAMLAGLHETLGFDKYLAEYGRRQEQKLEQALGNKRALEAAWKAEGRTSTFADTVTKFVHASTQMTNSEKIATLQFIENVAARADGRKALEVVPFHDDNRGSIGLHNGMQIKINVNSEAFEKSPTTILNAVVHEGFAHNGQQVRGQKVVSGEIGPGHPDYIVGKIFAAQMLTKAGYIAPTNALGSHDAYERNPVEMDARRLGDAGARILIASYGLNESVATRLASAPHAEPSAPANDRRGFRPDLAPRVA